jgi:vacuolar-type H+-ATPase subunit E/Vma4
MKVNEKLAFFSKIATQDAQQQRAKILDEMDKKLNDAIAEYTAEAERQAQKRIRDEGYKIEQKKNKEIVHASMNAKKEAIELRGSLIERLFGNVAQKIRDFTQTEAYKTYLVKELTNITKHYSNVKVYLMERDLPLVSDLQSEAEFIGEKDDFLGGFRLFVPDKHLMEDHTYLSSLKEAQTEFNGLQIKNYAHEEGQRKEAV